MLCAMHLLPCQPWFCSCAVNEAKASQGPHPHVCSIPSALSPPTSPLLQLGLRGSLGDRYAGGGEIVSSEDITPFVREMGERVAAAAEAGAGGADDSERWADLLVPVERVLPQRVAQRAHIAADEPPA